MRVRRPAAWAAGGGRRSGHTEPAAQPWRLTEMWIEDSDGVRIVLVEVPADHPAPPRLAAFSTGNMIHRR